MRARFEKAGEIVKIKSGVGVSTTGQDMSGLDFVIEDWWENIAGCSWLFANGNPAAIEYAIRNACYGDNNNVPLLSGDVLYGKVGPFGHLFHINELELG